MTCAQALNSAGLGLGMIGVLIIFRYGPPQPSFEEGIKRVIEGGTLLPDGRTAAEHDEDVRNLRSRHLKFSKLGLGLVFVGFAFQLFAIWV
jgi:hypothetical protein